MTTAEIAQVITISVNEDAHARISLQRGSYYSQRGTDRGSGQEMRFGRGLINPHPVMNAETSLRATYISLQPSLEAVVQEGAPEVTIVEDASVSYWLPASL